MFYPQKLKKIRLSNRWTISKLAQKLNITRQTLSLWERGKITPPDNRIYELANALSINVEEISDLRSIATEQNSHGIYSQLTEIKSNQIKNQRCNILNQINEQLIELENLSNLFQILLNSIKDIFFVKSLNLKYTLANNSFKKHLNLSADFNVIGKTDYDFFPKKEADENSNEDLAVINNGQPILNIERPILGSRKRKIGLISKYPIIDNGKIVGILTKIVDITEKKRMEFIQSIISDAISTSNFSLGIYNNTTNDFIYSSGNGHNIFGNTPELSGNNLFTYWLSIIHPEDRAEQMQYLKNLDKLPSERKYRILHPQKGERTIKVISSKTKFLGSKFIISISYDITKK